MDTSRSSETSSKRQWFLAALAGLGLAAAFCWLGAPGWLTGPALGILGGFGIGAISAFAVLAIGNLFPGRFLSGAIRVGVAILILVATCAFVFHLAGWWMLLCLLVCMGAGTVVLVEFGGFGDDNDPPQLKKPDDRPARPGSPPPPAYA
jgi:hypothetical protein